MPPPGVVQLRSEFTYAVWALLSVAMLGRFRGGTSGLLLAQLAIDLLFIVGTFSTLTPRRRRWLTVSLSGSSPRMVVSAQPHRAGARGIGIDRAAAGRAAAAYRLGAGDHAGRNWSAPVTSLLALLGMLAWAQRRRVGTPAALRTADVGALHINQVVVNELKMAFSSSARWPDRDGQQSATRWLGGDEASMQRGVQLHELSPDLHAAGRRSLFPAAR